MKDEEAYVSLLNRHLEMLFSKYAHVTLEYPLSSLLPATKGPQSTLLHLPIKDIEEFVYFIISLTYMRFSFESYYPMASELLSYHFKHVKKLAAIDPELESQTQNGNRIGGADDELSNIISEVARLQVNIQVFVVYELSLLPRELIQLFLTW